MNASERAPSPPWLRIFLLALLLTGTLLAGAEAFWRAKGITPSVVDTPELWAYWRDQVYADHPGTPLVLLGASRIQLGIDDAVLRADPDVREVVNLAVDGQCATRALRDLAEDQSFRGNVLISFFVHCFEPGRQQERSEQIRAHQDRNPNRRLNTLIAAYLQERLAILNPALSPVRIARQWAYRKPLTQANYLVTQSNRARRADYSLVDLAQHRARRIERQLQSAKEATALSQAVFARQLRKVNEWVTRIQSRGGKVAFVRFPTAGAHWAIDQNRYPKARFWDYLARNTPATAIHFHDIPGAVDLPLPDTSHLDFRDAKRFTVMLADTLRTQGFFKSTR